MIQASYRGNSAGLYHLKHPRVVLDLLFPANEKASGFFPEGAEMSQLRAPQPEKGTTLVRARALSTPDTRKTPIQGD